MNWYKLAIRYYDDIRREDYEEGKEGDELFEADQYFSIGQMQDDYDHEEGEEPEPATCWIYYNEQIDTAVGGTHNMNWPHLMKNNWYQGGNEHIRGWYDPNQDMVSIVLRRKPGDTRKYDESEVPKAVLRQLIREFGETIDIKVF